ncbi:MAG: hypothetical protein AB8B57_10350 [Congregibacter sp.]
MGSNLRIAVVCELDVAKKMSEPMREYYYRDYAMVIYLSDVDVQRDDKF